MVEFNLLPDVKMLYLRTKRFERLVITISFIIGAASLAAFIILFLFVDVAQKVTINDLTNQINTSSSKLTSNQDLNKILTIQNQLETIPQLEAQTPVVSSLFTFISQLTPLNATISSINIDFGAHTVSIEGGADTLATVNTYVDTIKYANYADATTNTSGNKAFNTVVLSSFNYTTTGNPPAEYTISFDFNPIIFSSDKISLAVPTQTTTRSILNQLPLFKSNPH